MALTSCPDCGTQVSDQAAACPKCARPNARAAKKGTSVLGIVLALIGIGAVVIIGLLAVMSIYGTRKYIANAKTAEARNSLGQIAKDAVTAYETSATGDERRHLCASASSPVPAKRTDVSGKKYQSSAVDWTREDKTDAGFSCLKFSMSTPQYFQYEYEADARGFVARAHGDLNGDGVFSTFEIRGVITPSGRLEISPEIKETNPEE